jgi:hypothetical protein
VTSSEFSGHCEVIVARRVKPGSARDGTCAEVTPTKKTTTCKSFDAAAYLGNDAIIAESGNLARDYQKRLAPQLSLPA